MSQSALLKKIAIEAHFGYKIEFSSSMGGFFTIHITTECGMTEKLYQHHQLLGKEDPTDERVIHCIDFMIDEIRKQRTIDLSK